MDLPNKYFEDFPIEYKKIRRDDFSVRKEEFTSVKNPNGFSFIKKVHKENRSRYLNEDLQGLISLDEKETMVISAPVGNGKSFAIIQTIKRFYESKEKDYLIIVATPFVSLVKQYVNEIHTDGKIPKNQIYNYNKIGRSRESYTDMKVHVITANTLLGNPGDDSYKNSDKKRKYLNELIEDCESKGKKVVFIFDEIHDTIQNFKEEYLFNLWRWKNVVHKNFIISATFTEASFVVIEYLAELTDKKIYVVEFPRLRIRENQSKLFLYYCSSHKFLSTTYEIRNTIENLLDRGKDIDILCYSKTLAKSIISDKVIGKKLKEKFGRINDCTSENVDNQRPFNEPAENIFDNNMCNIGTNFKSGVSIKKENHAFVIILPSRHTQGKFKNNYGIFSSGITSIIQALARQRTKGEIHIILPRPNEFNYESLKSVMSKDQIKIFSDFYEQIKHHSVRKEEEIVNYIPLLFQNLLVKKFYTNDLKGNVSAGIEQVKKENRTDLARLEFPPYKNFKLNESENYLASTYGFFGADISAYTTYCAFTNQFVNCYLEGVEYKQTLWFQEGRIQKDLYSQIFSLFEKDYIEFLFGYSNFHKAYLDFREKLFTEFNLKYKRIKKENAKNEPVWEIINEYKNSKFEQQLLRFCVHHFYGKNYFYSEDFKNRKVDLKYSRGQYFRDGIKSSLGVNLDEIDYTKEEMARINAFKSLNYFREKLINKISHHSRGNENYNYLPVNSFANFIETSDLSRFYEVIEYFRDVDNFTSKGIFNFSRRFEGSFEKIKESFYSILIEDFFKYEARNNNPRKKINNVPTPIFPNIEVVSLPASNRIINLVEKPLQEEIEMPDEFMEFVEKEYGGIDEYNQKITDLLNQSE